jgi:hypothetical protein
MDFWTDTIAMTVHLPQINLVGGFVLRAIRRMEYLNGDQHPKESVQQAS